MSTKAPDLAWMNEWRDYRGYREFGPWSVRAGNHWYAVQTNGRAFVAILYARVFPQPPRGFRPVIVRHLRAKPPMCEYALVRFRRWIGDYMQESEYSRYSDRTRRPVRIFGEPFDGNAVADVLRFVKGRKVRIAAADRMLYVDSPDWRVAVCGLREDYYPASIPAWPALEAEP